ncbi:DgyrCDS3456 [Dimorphilus gyrociliatus]|uniref:DgyrCDS3456 n=1 Tax=Dimorphilus gyrociliatus TaxID=2664684 RepID=A0A7I8VIC5_9ANNE|nr:DgyrCDS3456 [Dimorphilus gyrociliatus]
MKMTLSSTILRFLTIVILFASTSQSFQDCEKVEGKGIIITGASKGIGREIAKQLSKCNVNLMAVGRNVENLESLQEFMTSNNEKGTFTTLSIDVAKEGNPKKLVQKALTQFNKIDHVFFSHALLGNYSHFTGLEEDFDLIRQMMEVNFYSVTRLIAEITKYSKGYIPNFIIFSSQLVAEPHPTTFAYCVSKSALIAFAKTLQFKLYQKQISVKIVDVPGTDTHGLYTSHKIFYHNYNNKERSSKLGKDFDEFFELKVKPHLADVKDVAEDIILSALGNEEHVDLVEKHKRHSEL